MKHVAKEDSTRSGSELLQKLTRMGFHPETGWLDRGRFALAWFYVTQTFLAGKRCERRALREMLELGYPEIWYLSLAWGVLGVEPRICALTFDPPGPFPLDERLKPLVSSYVRDWPVGSNFPVQLDASDPKSHSALSKGSPIVRWVTEPASRPSTRETVQEEISHSMRAFLVNAPQPKGLNGRELDAIVQARRRGEGVEIGSGLPFLFCVAGLDDETIMLPLFISEPRYHSTFRDLKRIHARVVEGWPWASHDNWT